MRVLVELSVFGRARTVGQTRPFQLFVPQHKYPPPPPKKKNQILCRIVISSKTKKNVLVWLSTALTLDLLFPLSLSLSPSRSPYSFDCCSISLQFWFISISYWVGWLMAWFWCIEHHLRFLCFIPLFSSVGQVELVYRVEDRDIFSENDCRFLSWPISNFLVLDLASSSWFDMSLLHSLKIITVSSPHEPWFIRLNPTSLGSPRLTDFKWIASSNESID